MAAPTVPQADRPVLGAYLMRRVFEILGAGIIVLALVLAVALFGHDATDPSLNRASPGPASNPLGGFGAALADLSLQSVGLAIWVVVLILPFWGLRLILDRPMQWFWIALTALPAALLAAAAFLATLQIPESWPYWVGLGGFVGDFMLHRLERPLGGASYAWITGWLALLLIVLALGITWREAWSGLRWLIALPFRARAQRPDHVGVPSAQFVAEHTGGSEHNGR